MVASQPVIQSLKYLERLWSDMHHSDNPGSEVLALTSFFDDSGSDDNSPITTIGGPVMAKNAFLDLGPEWERILHLYRIPQPLHMTDFVRPHGKHIGLHFEMKLALFADISQVINELKLYSISVGVPQVEFHGLLSENVRKKVLGSYAFAFLCAVLANGIMGERITQFNPSFREDISYLVDSGFPYSEQLVSAHAAILQAEQAKGKYSYVGRMAFDIDDRVPCLQAADVIAWCSRKKAIDGSLKNEFEPLELLLSNHTLASGKKSLHCHIPLDADGIRKFANPVNNWLSLGVLPSLQNILR